MLQLLVREIANYRYRRNGAWCGACCADPITSEEVGIYRAATQGALLVVFFLTAVNLVIAPYISQLYTAGNMPRLQRLATTSARAILLAALPVASAFVLFGNEGPHPRWHAVRHSAPCRGRSLM